jgi:hypothetical protein
MYANLDPSLRLSVYHGFLPDLLANLSATMKLRTTVGLFSLFFIQYVASVTMNIHVRLDKQLNSQVLKYYAQIKQYAPNDQIDFVNTQYPHVTLYLTQFMDNATNMIIQT